MSLEVIILRGLPASGKTTWAREHMRMFSKFIRVNRDDLRKMMHNFYSEVNESMTRKAEDFLVKLALFDDRNVIIDDTNLVQSRVDDLYALVQSTGLDVIVKEVRLTTAIQECIQRDSLRPSPVGEDAIYRLDREGRS